MASRIRRSTNISISTSTNTRSINSRMARMRKMGRRVNTTSTRNVASVTFLTRKKMEQQ